MLAQDDLQAEISIAKLKNRDRKEFARLVELYSDLVYRLGYRMLGNEQDAEDVLQDTFINVYRAIPDFKEKAALKTWIYRIAMNEALMLIRKQKGIPISLDEERDEDQDEFLERQIIDWCCLPEDEFLSEEVRDRMREAMDTLTPVLRSVFVLRDLQDLSIQETATALGISESAVKTRLVRARMKLRDEMSHYFEEKV